MLQIVNIRRLIALGAGAALFTALAAGTASPGVAAPKTAGSPPVFQKLLAKYRALKSYQATIKTLVVLQPTNGSKPNVIDSTMNLSYKSPNLGRMDIQGLMGGGMMVSDGTTLYTYSALTNQYSSQTAPKALLNSLMGPIQHLTSLSPAGKATIDGAPAAEYKGAGRGGSMFELYIDQKTQLIRRLIVRNPHLPGPQGESFRMTTTADYLAQKLNPVLDPGMFRFTPPAGAEKGSAGMMPSILGAPGATTR